jgi:sec-independent protein translocase protein TatA
MADLLSPLHLALLLIVALLIFGPRRLPELGSAVGKTIKEFQKSMADARNQMADVTAAVTSEAHAQAPAAAPTVVASASTTSDAKPN